jgi:hypothetical protein
VFPEYIPLQLCFHWNKSFSEGRQDVEDSKRLNPSVTMKTDKVVEEVSIHERKYSGSGNEIKVLT